jgi:predicted site-specific integrase-resolvase
MNSAEVCAELGISTRTLQRLRANKMIGFLTVATGSFRYHRQRHFEAFLERRETKARVV